MVIIYHRHGARTPSKFYQPGVVKPDPGKMKLTQQGYEEMVQLGQTFRQKYLENQKFLPIQPQFEKMYTISSIKSRAIKSGIGFLNGIYGEYDFNKIVKKVIQNQIFPLHLNTNSTKRYNFCIPKKQKDFFFHAYKTNICPKVKLYQDLIKNSQKYKETLKKYQQNLFPKLAEEMNKITYWHTNFKADSMDFKDLSHINDLIKFGQYHNITENIPQFDKDTFKQINEAKIYEQFNVNFGDENIIKICSTTFLQTLQYFLKKYISGDSQVNFLHISGHDTELASILRSILNPKHYHFLHKKLWILPYAVHLVFELHQNNGYYYIKTFLNDKPMQIKTCLQEKCQIQSFIKVLKKGQEERSLEKICFSKNKQREKKLVDDFMIYLASLELKYYQFQKKISR